MTCFYQVFKKPYLPMEGWGDCRTCKPDEKNINCRGFIKINLTYAEVADENTKQEANPQRAED